ncbi:MAG: ParA family protein [Lachnospiraceae bacterium]|nr:ParA family protein [Lachnospiraceae bacterium]
MLSNLKQFVIITGHYGCGKTNLSINLAIDAAKAGEKVTIVDMDLVNPYFRVSDYRSLLEGYGIDVITPVFGATNLDIPSLPASMYSIFDREGRVIVDVGGDDVGSTVLGRFRPQLLKTDYDMLYVINRFRSMTVTAEETVEILREIEEVSSLKAAKLVNNSHLMSETTDAEIRKGIEYAAETAKLTGLKVIANVVSDKAVEAGRIDISQIPDPYVVSIYTGPGYV